MKAFVQTGYGASDVIEPRELEVPTPGPGDVLIRTNASTTDGYAAAGRETEPGEDMTVYPVIAVIDRNCAEHAREKLMVGLTNYYLQRRLRPGATSDDAAETSSLTGGLAGPGDPAAMTPETSCRG